jgi:hypothetical protein
VVPLATRLTAFFAGMVAVAVDAGAVLYQFGVEQRRYEAATPIEGRITNVRRRSDLVSLELSTEHPTAGSVRFNDEHNIRDLRREVPPDVLAKIEASQVPIPVSLRYDPANARRLWLGYAHLSRANSVHWWSLCAVFFQAVLWCFLLTRLRRFAFDNLLVGVLLLEGFFLWFMFLVDLLSGMLP